MPTCPVSPADPALPHTLLCHPAQPASAVRAVTASARFGADGELLLAYRVHGDLASLCIPAPAAPGPVDGLWQHTCLEAFVAGGDGESYREFNFSPSGQWAAYRFAGYRARDDAFQPPGAPRIRFAPCPDGFLLYATLAPELLPAATALALGLSAVIEAADGSKSYWALAHGATQPDFHLRQGFALTLQRSIP